MTNIAWHCWKGWDSARNGRRSIAQHSSQRKSGKQRRRICWRNRKRRVREVGGDAKLHELGQVGRATRRERDVHEEVDEGMQTLGRGDGDVGDAGVETRLYGSESASGFRLGKGTAEKSTSGGMMTVNATLVKHWWRTQASRALGSAEAGYAALVTGAAEGLGMQSMMTDLGLSARGFCAGQTPTQPKRLFGEDRLERPDSLN